MLPEDRQLGHYRLVRRIGGGGMGEVYLAEDTRINRQVAIKVVRTETEPFADSVAMQDTMRLFQREMRAVTMLDHPHILPLFDFGEEKDGNSILTYMVMPLREEGSLTDWLQKRGNTEKLTQDEVAYFVMQAADALQHAHDRQLIHQDVKPSNFLIVCQNGSYKVFKYVSNRGSDATLLSSGSSPAIHTGLGQQNKMAVVASGRTMTFYVNEQQIDQVQDSSYASGNIALIAEPQFGNVTDVVYSNAKLWTVYPSYLSGNGPLAFFDSLNQEGGSKWNSLTGSNGVACQFTGGAYHVIEQDPNYFHWCSASGTYSNFAFEVQFTITQGDCGGMVFRQDGNGQRYYSFSICQDGRYQVTKYVSNSSSNARILRASSSSAIHTGLGQQNKMAIVASGSIMTFYANEQQIVQEQDSSYTVGRIGLLAAPNSRTGNATDVAYNNASLWTM